jgi:hypothetical protein
MIAHSPFLAGALYVEARRLLKYIFSFKPNSCTYDHRVWRTGLPVRSAVLKPIIVRSQFSMRLGSKMAPDLVLG